MDDLEQRRETHAAHYIAFRAATALAAKLSRPAQYRIAAVISRMYHDLDLAARTAVRGNLDQVFRNSLPPAEVRRIVRQVFASFGCYVAEFLSGSVANPEFIDRQVLVSGREHLDAARRAGKGAIFCSGHYSNWELGAAVVARMGYPILAIVQRHAHAKVDELFVAARQERGIAVAHSEHGARAALRTLAQNGTVAILGDRATGEKCVAVDFFGRTARFPLGPWRLSVASGAPLLPTFVWRREDGFMLEIGAPLEVHGYTSRDENVAALAQAWAQRFEARVRADPGQWECFYPIWAD